MKNLTIIYNAIILTAIGVLFALYFSMKSNTTTKNTNKQEPLKEQKILLADTTNHLYKFAYINVDTFLANYKLYDVLQEKLLKKQKQLEANLNRKTQEFQKEYADFQKKVQTNSFLSQESAQAQQQELYNKQQKLLQLRDQLTNELLQEKQNLENQLLDSVINYLQEFNQKQHYTFIFNANAFLVGDKSLDITKIIVTNLNKRYEQSIQAKK